LQGGRHVDHVAELIIKQLIETLKKKNKAGLTIKPFQIKNHLWIFINCLINNPSFDSQTKENMTLQAKNFGSRCTFTDKFITSVSANIYVERLVFNMLCNHHDAIVDDKSWYCGSSVVLGKIQSR
jgi:DNA topoisomerase-2